MQQPAKRNFFRCEKCGKRLIERLPNGLWRFIFGKPSETSSFVPVELKIHGSLVMRCLRRKCRREYPDHWNVLNFFPTNRQIKSDESINSVESSDVAVPEDIKN
jgi:hypothetical protein